MVAALSALQHVGFGQHCSSVGSSARSFFGQVRCPRSHFACVTLAGFGCTRLLSFRAPAPEPVTSGRFSGKVARRAQASGLRFSASSPGLHPRWLPSRLTSRSSRRRVVASLKLPGVRAILAPIRRVRRGLTPALGGRKAFCKCAANMLESPASGGVALRSVSRCVASSVKPV